MCLLYSLQQQNVTLQDSHIFQYGYRASFGGEGGGGGGGGGGGDFPPS